MSSTDPPQGDGAENSALRDFLRMLGRHVPILLATVVLVSSSALAFSLRADKKYTATTKLLFRDPGFDQKLFGSSILSASQDPAREAATNVDLVSLDTIIDRTSTELGDRITPLEIHDKVEVTSQGQSDVVAVKATDTSPATAAELANTVGEQYIRFRRDADRSKITEALGLVRKQSDALSSRERAGSQGRSVKARVEQLEILASLQTGNAELVQRAKPPTEASSPLPVRNTIIGLIVGFVLGIAFATLLDRLDRRLRHRGEAEAILERPVLGIIPESRALRADGGEALHLAGAEGEGFRTLRTNLRFFDVDHDVHSLLITSSAPGDGKSTIARYLAATAAASDVRVVLVEADLRRPTLRRLFSGLHEGGLTNVLAGQIPIAEAIQQLPLQIAGRSVTPQLLDVVVTGPVPPNPTDLLESDRMGDVLAELKERYELIIVDTSPVSIVPDAIPLMGLVSGVVIVIREMKSTRTAVRQLRKQFDNLKISPLGIVVNGAASSDRDSYYYGYYTLDSAGEKAEAHGDGHGNGAHRSRWPKLRRRDRIAPVVQVPQDTVVGTLGHHNM